MSLRQATPSDIDDILEIMLKSVQHDSYTRYRFPYQDEYPVEYANNVRLIFEYFLRPEYNNDWHVMVIEAPDTQDTSPKIAATAVWDISYIQKRKYGATYKASTPDKDSENDPRALPKRYVNDKRLAAFQSGLGAARKQYLDDVYGAEQIHLGVLATHPDHQRRGYASTLVRWGMDKARADNVVLTNFATEVGKEFYPRLGSRYLGDAIAQVAGEEEKVMPGIFVYDPSQSHA